MNLKQILFLLAFSLSGFLTGCGHDDSHHCTANVAGCAADQWSCTESSFCYDTESACAASGTCDD